MREVNFNSGERVRDLKGVPDRDEQLRKACKEFESVFTNELLKSMRRTIEKCDLFHGGQGEEIYESLLDQELSKKMAGLSPGSLANVLYRQFKQETADGAMEDPALYRVGNRADQPLLNPLKQGRVSSAYGWRKDPITGGEQFHHGIDLAAPEGSPVRAAMEGKVIASEFKEKYGNLVIVDHGRGLTTLYAHNRENRVKEGDWVKRGELLATVGSTGRSTGPHLHFEVKREGAHQDPHVFLNRFAGEQIAHVRSTLRVDEEKE
jgi:murein DD-endopeptidase MepM/ murein hydrolase activator NlpD